jgi:fumarate reductase flavoprotein subunit
MSYDLIIIGGGFAGLTVANRAAALGLTPLVLEASADALYPCNSRYSTGSLHVGFIPPSTPPDDLYAAIIRNTDGAARPDLARAVADRAADTLAWLREEGAAFEDHPRRDDHMPMLSPLREMRAGLDWEGSGANNLLQRMEDALAKRSGTFRRGARVTKIVTDNGAAVGVEIGAETILAPAIVIADGGFPANPEMIHTYIGSNGDTLQQRNAGTARGEGLRMAQAAGAAVTGMECFYGHVLSRNAMTNAMLWPYPQVDVICASGVVVDSAGKRFADEGLGGIYMANAIARSGNALDMTAVFDTRVWEEAKTKDNVPPNPSLPDAGGTVIEAPTIEALAGAAGIDGAGLTGTVAAFNAWLSAGGNAPHNPPRTLSTYPAQPIAEPPFYAIPLCAGITVTSGGIAVNGSGQVVDANDAPIPGLYAAGSAVGGLEGGPRAAYLGGLIKSFCIGMIAAETIAAARQP